MLSWKKTDRKKSTTQIEYYQKSIKEYTDTFSNLNKQLIVENKEKEALEAKSFPIINYYHDTAIKLFHDTNFLDYRAWKFVDVLLYALEVMKKETLKEALSYVQQQKNHN